MNLVHFALFVRHYAYIKLKPNMINVTLRWEWWYIQRMAAAVREGFSDPYAVSNALRTTSMAWKWLCFQYLPQKRAAVSSCRCRRAVTKVVQKQAAGLPVPVRCRPAVAKEPPCRLRDVFVLVLVLPRQKTTWREEICQRQQSISAVTQNEFNVKTTQKIFIWFRQNKISN